MEVLLISTARNILHTKSRERDRMRLYANHVDNLHIILFTQKDKIEEIHEGNLHIYPTNSLNKAKTLLDAYVIGKRIVKKERKESIVISSQDPLWTGLLTWLLSWLKNTTFQIQLHGDYFGIYWSRGSVLRKIAKMWAKFLIQRADTVRVVSMRIKRSLVDLGIKEKKIKVLPIRPELESFLERNHAHAEKSSYSLLFVGRFAPEKDIRRILLAFSKVYANRQDITLKLVGEGTELSKINSFIKRKKLEDAVSVSEWTEYIVDIMANSDVLLLSSKHEAYGLVLIEAMAVGLPVISTDVGCVGEVVKDGVHGIIVKDSGIEPYAKAIEEMLGDINKMKEYGENGKKTAEKIAELSLDDYAREWVNTMSHKG